MNITERMLTILIALWRYKFLTTAQIRRWCVPTDKDGSVTRDVLRKMAGAGLARRFKAEVHNPIVTSSVPVWTPTEPGCCLLAAKTGDAKYILDAMPNTNGWHMFAHYVEVSELMHTIETAFAAQQHAKLMSLYFEHDVISDAKEPEKRFRLYTLVREDQGKRIVCVPDAAVEVAVAGYRRAYYIEDERGTDTPRRASAKKAPGYSMMQNHFKKHFPDAQDWRVLFIWPNAGLRDAARRAVDPAKSEMWLFAALPDITESFLHAPVIYSAQDGPKPFIKPPPGTAPAAEQATEQRKERS
jgi:hypothetical protein